MSEATITISKEEYKRLRKDALFLQCLKNGGVDNWDWYDHAQEDFDEEILELEKELGT